MRIIISPAKKMHVDTDSFPIAGLPQFLPEAETLMKTLQGLSPEELKTLWKCSDAIAALNIERLRHMDLRQGLTPALLAYEGIQYQYMAPGVFTDGQMAFVQEHLRILSGFYGLLRPFDGVTPYRLEMQARLLVDGCRDLYGYWSSKLAAQLGRETDLVLNLASKEYSRAVESHLSEGVRFLTCTFGEWTGGKAVEKGTMCKMARGQMVRWLAERAVTDPEEIKAFADLGYAYEGRLSDRNNYVFCKAAHR